jgi:hypothetical protein
MISPLKITSRKGAKAQSRKEEGKKLRALRVFVVNNFHSWWSTIVDVVSLKRNRGVRGGRRDESRNLRLWLLIGG